jgi:hypothetical protein
MLRFNSISGIRARVKRDRSQIRPAGAFNSGSAGSSASSSGGSSGDAAAASGGATTCSLYQRDNPVIVVFIASDAESA